MERLIGTKEIAEYLGLSREYVTDRVTKRQGFPNPRINTSIRNRKWSAQEVIVWAAGPQSRQRKTPGNANQQ